MSEVLIERIASAHYYADAQLVERYSDVFKLHPLMDLLAFRANLILVGPSGVGKSLAVASWCAAHKYPLVTFDCSEDARRHHLLGHYTQRSTLETPFVLGPIPTAYEIANEVGVCVLALEEINALSPAVQKNLNPTCDFRQKMELPEAKRVFSLRSGARLFVVGTMNEANVYGGVNELNRDLKSRFRIYTLSYPSKEDEIKAVKTALGGTVGNAKMLDHLASLAVETRQRAMEYALSTRDLVQIMEDAAASNIETALMLAKGKFEGTDRSTFSERVQAHFNIFI